MISDRKPQFARLRLAQTADQIEAQRHAANNANARVLGLVWYRQYPGDTLSIARGWPMVVLGAYHTLRDLQWDSAALPAEPNDIRRLAGIQPRQWRLAWPLLGLHFPIDADGRRRNPQLAEQRYEAVGQRWQKIDAINVLHHPDTAYLGAAADAYLKDVRSPEPTPVRTGVHTSQHQHQHQRRNAYQGAVDGLGESPRSGEAGCRPLDPDGASLGKRAKP